MIARFNKVATAVTVLGSTLAAATPVNFYNELVSRQALRYLPQNASLEELRFQPVLDFDKDGCYNVPAIGPDGDISGGLGHSPHPESQCRDQSDLDNNNLYVRSRCNNGWCAYVYTYYFERDSTGAGSLGAGHRHDWEHIVVIVEGDTPRIAAASRHGDYDTRDWADAPKQGDGVKVVYHKDGGLTHAFRFANPDDEEIENHNGEWFKGDVVGWNGFPSTEIRDKLMAHDFGSATIGIKDSSFKAEIDKARNGGAPGFDSGVDG